MAINDNYFIQEINYNTQSQRIKNVINMNFALAVLCPFASNIINVNTYAFESWLCECLVISKCESVDEAIFNQLNFFDI